MNRPDRPAFLITIDTEGDNLWARPRVAGTRNAEFLPRFQALCERHGFKPTYLTNHEMALSPAFREFARDALSRGTAEVGMHLHAWDSPPLVPLTPDDSAAHPFLIDYPDPLMREKVAHMTGLLEDTFGVKMRSHRAGRWAFDERYARLLVEFGYCVDCSVTPGQSWAFASGAPGRFGTDYTGFPDQPYFIDLQDIRRPGASPLLELPMTIRSSWLRRHAGWVYGGWPGKAVRRVSPELSWLRPARGNLQRMLDVVRWSLRRGDAHLEFMLHSSEFMPGGSPTFPDGQAIERLYADMETLFEFIARTHEGMTLAGFHDRHVASTGARGATAQLATTVALAP